MVKKIVLVVLISWWVCIASLGMGEIIPQKVLGSDNLLSSPGTTTANPLSSEGGDESLLSSAKKGQSGWPVVTGGGIHCAISLADIDEDGKLEVVTASFDQKVYVLNEDGTSVPGWPVQTGFFNVSFPVFGNIDGDKNLEMIVGSNDKKVYVLKVNGDSAPNWPVEIGGPIRSSPALGDIDGNGKLEIIIASDDKKYMYLKGMEPCLKVGLSAQMEL